MGLGLGTAGYLAISHKGPDLSSNIQHQINMLVLMNSSPVNSFITLSHEHKDYKWVTELGELTWHFAHDKQAERVFAFLQSGDHGRLDVKHGDALNHRLSRHKYRHC